MMPQIHNTTNHEKTFEHIELELAMQRKEKKLEELYEELSGVEKERTRLREVVIRFEDDSRVTAQQFEECKIENLELKKHIEIYEEKLA
jgi:predicted nuclease with TOPRIM domain